MINTVGWRSDEVAGQIRGPKGTLVRLEMPVDKPRCSNPHRELVRDKINLEDAKAKSKIVEFNGNGSTYKIGVISVPDFYLNHRRNGGKPLGLYQYHQ